MKIAAISVKDELNPIEVQTWLDAHPTAILLFFYIDNSIFYIIY